MTDPALIERITRSLAFMLRHQPETFDLELDPFGYADLEDVVQALNERLGEPVEEEDVREAVGAGDRPRYEIQGDRIRALYGHSIPVDPGPSAKPPEFLFVAVPEQELERARRFGLRGGRRRFLHLAATKEDAAESGRRASRDYTVLLIHALDAWEEGISFYDRVALWLAEEVPTHLLEVEGTYHDGTDPLPRRFDGPRGERDRGHERQGGGGGYGGHGGHGGGGGGRHGRRGGRGRGRGRDRNEYREEPSAPPRSGEFREPAREEFAPAPSGESRGRGPEGGGFERERRDERPPRDSRPPYAGQGDRGGERTESRPRPEGRGDGREARQEFRPEARPEPRREGRRDERPERPERHDGRRSERHEERRPERPERQEERRPPAREERRPESREPRERMPEPASRSSEPARGGGGGFGAGIEHRDEAHRREPRSAPPPPRPSAPPPREERRVESDRPGFGAGL